MIARLDVMNGLWYWIISFNITHTLGEIRLEIVDRIKDPMWRHQEIKIKFKTSQHTDEKECPDSTGLCVCVCLCACLCLLTFPIHDCTGYDEQFVPSDHVLEHQTHTREESGLRNLDRIKIPLLHLYIL